MTKLDYLIRRELEQRKLAQAFERKAQLHWNEASKLLLEIRSEAESERELDCSQQSNSLGV